MGKSQPVLTISLLSSGRIDTIERCLSSFDDIKEKIDTEIIIVDTDPDHREDVHKILEKYADRIIPFEWCDDFSKARNVGINAAKGQWFLYVDDDEWFLDSKPLVDFIILNTDSEYGWANIRLRNFNDFELKRYADTWISRLFRITPTLRFTGIAHEFIEHTTGKYANVEALLGHTGYIYKDEEEKKAHARRNLKGLEILMKENPLQGRWIFQAMGEYEDLGDYKKSIELAQKGYDLMRGGTGYQAAIFRGGFASNHLRLLVKNDEWAECVRVYKKYVAGEKLGKVSRAQMEMNAAQAEYNLGKTKNAAKHCKNYLTIYDEMTSKPVEYVDEYVSFLGRTLKEDYHDLIASMLMDVEITDGKWTSFEEFFDTVSWGSTKGHNTDQFERRLLMAAFQKADYNPHFVHMVEVFWKEPKSRNVVQQLLVEGMNQGADIANNPAWWNLVHAVAEINVGSAVPWDVKIIWADFEARMGKITDVMELHSKMQEYYRNMFASSNPLLTDGRLWEIGLRRGAILNGRIREVPLPRWQACVEGFLKEADVGFIHKISGILEEVYLDEMDEWYGYFLARTDQHLKELAIQKDRSTEQEKIADEMKLIIKDLESKVQELLQAGMTDEAEQVMKEIQKYSLPDR